jgi:hypothetical protein
VVGPEEGTLKVAKELHRLREIRLQGVREEAIDSVGTRLRGWHTDKLRPYHLRRSTQSEYEEFKASVQLAKETLATVVVGGIVVELR